MLVTFIGMNGKIGIYRKSAVYAGFAACRSVHILGKEIIHTKKVVMTSKIITIKDMRDMNKNVIIYGSPGTGKSRGFFMPFALQAVKRNESLITVDPKAEFYEMYSEFLREQGYTVKAYNLLDLCASDGWNCVAEAANDLNLVQNVAEIIINNTSSESDRDDFWAKAEKICLWHYFTMSAV